LISTFKIKIYFYPISKKKLLPSLFNIFPLSYQERGSRGEVLHERSRIKLIPQPLLLKKEGE
jgi:hypothetical protein